ncbi:MAG: hypothetical protein K2K66_00470 [Ruminococcus sp.]|nr:hypothetical protein [Ruminococcus sp.]
MYYGKKITKELERLYSEYENIWGHDPSGYENAEYGEDEYDEYVEDIKKALEMGVELPNIYPHDDEY